MIDASLNNLINPNVTGPKAPGGPDSSSSSSSGTSFADTLKKSIDEVSKLQQDATDAVDGLATGKTQNVSGVMTAVEKSDLAFKTLLAIRAKLMDAYEEIKGISV
jgi:flagellar hook-basal body complex protein FliE